MSNEIHEYNPAYVSECAFLKAKESLMDWTDADSLKRL